MNINNPDGNAKLYELQHLTYGQCFSYNDILYMKLKILTQPTSIDLIYTARLEDGTVATFDLKTKVRLIEETLKYNLL